MTVSRPLDGVTVVNVEQAVAAPSATRQRWRQVQTPGGPVPALLPPWSISGVEPRMDPVPAVGEHTDAILAALGLDEDRIAELRRTGAV